MKRIFVPTKEADDWRRLLAKPDLHWKAGRSAMTLAKSWESSHPELPPEVTRALEASAHPSLADLRLLAAFPEYQVDLPGGDRASQTDLLVIARNEHGSVVIAVEGKVDEEFGPTLGSKRREASPGQTARIDFLHQTLGLQATAPDHLRYQLFHRTASAVLVAQDFHAHAAVMLVHSFSASNKWYEDFETFAGLLTGPIKPNVVAQATTTPSVPALFVGWCQGDRRFAGKLEDAG